MAQTWKVLSLYLDTDVKHEYTMNKYELANAYPFLGNDFVIEDIVSVNIITDAPRHQFSVILNQINP